MGKLIAGLLIGILVGGALTFFTFVGVPSASKVPGAVIQPPDPNGMAPGTAQIVLRQDFFNDLLGAMYENINAPSFPLGPNAEAAPNNAEGACSGHITVLKEGSGVQTGVSFANDKLAAPMAFTGAYQSPFGCVRFSGWAQTNLELRFDAQSKRVFGQVNVETVNLDGVNPVVAGLLTPIVQSTINSRVNPIQILSGEQVAVNMPIAAVRGNLLANVSDVRAEVRDGALSLYVVYEFDGTPASTETASRP